MERLFLLLLFTVLGFASCSNEYKPKNDAEALLLAYIHDSLGYSGEVTYLELEIIDTVYESTKFYQDTFSKIFPGAENPVRFYDSLQIRYKDAVAMMDTVMYIVDYDRGRFSSEWSDKYHVAEKEYQKLHKPLKDNAELIDKYKRFLSTGQNSLATVTGGCKYVYKEDGKAFFFGITADAKHVLFYWDPTDTYNSSPKHINPFKK